MSKSNTNRSGISFLSVLALIFITLKLTDNIDWSWWWVTSPLWLPAAIALGVFLVIFIYVALKDIFFHNEKGPYDGKH